MSGAGTWTIGSSTKTYSGDTTVLTGTLQLGTGAALPNGAGKGNLIIATGGTMELTNQGLSINGFNDGPAGAITSDNPTGWATANGPGGGVLDNAVGMVTVTLGNDNAAGLFSGVISGGINLIKTGTGTQILSGDNTYSGTTTISAGILQVGIGGTPGSMAAGDGGFTGKLGNGTITNNATLVFNRGYLTTCSNLITGNGTLKQTANAELVLGTSNTYTGPTIIGQGIVNHRPRRSQRWHRPRLHRRLLAQCVHPGKRRRRQQHRTIHQRRQPISSSTAARSTTAAPAPPPPTASSPSRKTAEHI